MQGHPRFAIAPGARRVHEFTVGNRACSCWFHPHPHGRTGMPFYAGLAALFLVSDDVELTFGLSVGARELPPIVQDRSFYANNLFVHLPVGRQRPRSNVSGPRREPAGPSDEEFHHGIRTHRTTQRTPGRQGQAGQRQQPRRQAGPRRPSSPRASTSAAPNATGISRPSTCCAACAVRASSLSWSRKVAAGSKARPNTPST